MTTIDPIEPTEIGPGLSIIPLGPTPWDDAEDGQHAITDDGTVWQRRKGLWHMDPWWQGEDAEQILYVCANPDEWAYDPGWTRKHVENAKGSLTFITLPGGGYPHSDDGCRQDSIDAEGFRDACRRIAAMAAAAGLPDAGLGLIETVELLIKRAGGAS